jgi:PhnB protein
VAQPVRALIAFDTTGVPIRNAHEEQRARDLHCHVEVLKCQAIPRSASNCGGQIMATKAIPDGYHSVTPYLIINGAADAIDFYKRAFGATELMRMPSPDGRIGHAEIRIGDSAIMLADEHPAMGYRSPQSLGGSGVSLMVYVERVDEVFKRAVGSGAKELQPLKDQFYGDRSGTLQDPFGHTWTLATHIEDVPPDEMRRRAEKFMKSASA